MALLEKGLTWTVWALGGLVAFFFGLVGASPPAWAESGARMAQAERSSAPPPRPPAPLRVKRPSEYMMGEVIPKLEMPPAESEAKGYMKIEGIKGESQGKVFPKVEPLGHKVREATPKLGSPIPAAGASYPKLEGLPGESQGATFPKLETLPGESEAKGYMKIEGIKGESQGKVLPKVESESR